MGRRGSRSRLWGGKGAGKGQGCVQRAQAAAAVGSEKQKGDGTENGKQENTCVTAAGLGEGPGDGLELELGRLIKPRGPPRLTACSHLSLESHTTPPPPAPGFLVALPLLSDHTPSPSLRPPDALHHCCSSLSWPPQLALTD